MSTFCGVKKSLLMVWA